MPSTFWQLKIKLLIKISIYFQDALHFKDNLVLQTPQVFLHVLFTWFKCILLLRSHYISISDGYSLKDEDVLSYR